MLGGNAPKDVVKLLSGSVIATLFRICSTVIFARVLTKSQMAIFPTNLMLGGLIMLVLTFGIYAAFVRELPSLLRSDLTRARSLVITGTGFILAGTIIPCAACWLWSGTVAGFVFRDPTQSWVIQTLVPGFFAYVVTRTVDQIMQGCGRFGAISILQVLEASLRPIVTIALYFWLGYRGIVIGIALAQFVAALVSLWLIRDLFARPFPPLYPLRKLLSQSMPYYIGNYLSYFRGDGDSIFVTTFLGPAALAEYYVAKTLFMNMNLIWNAVDRVATERLARFVDTPAYPEKLKALHARTSQLLIPLSMLAIACAPGALVILAGVRYADAIWPAIVLLLASLAMFIAIPYDRGVYVALPGLIRLKFTVVEAVVTVVFAATLAPLAGIIGVAFARIAAPTGITLFGAHLLRRHLGIHLPLRPILLGFATAMPGTLLALIIGGHPHGTLAAVLSLAGSIIVWTTCFLLLAFALNRELLTTLATEATRRYRAAFST